jgi:hypothetical protein
MEDIEVEPIEEPKVIKNVRNAGRKKAVKPEGDVIEIETNTPEVISYTKAKELIKEKKPYVASEKQKANTLRLIEANKLKREQKKKELEEQKFKEEEAKKLEDAKLKKKKYIVKPKKERVFKNKVSLSNLPNPDSSDDDSSDTAEETEGTKTIKKKINNIKKIENTISTVQQNPYVALLQKNGYKLF